MVLDGIDDFRPHLLRLRINR